MTITEVRIGDGICTDLTVVDATTLTCVTPAIAAGTYDLQILSPGGDVRVEDAFTFTGAPTVTSIVPTSAVRGTPVAVTITGSNFTPDAVASIQEATLTNQVVVNTTTITATATSTTEGTRDVNVTTASGDGTLQAAFTFTAPPPAAPANVRMQPRTGLLTDRIAEWDPPAVQPVGYEYQARFLDGGWGNSVFSTGADRTTWRNSALEEDREYLWRFRAFNGTESAPIFSPYSNVVDFNTLPLVEPANLHVDQIHGPASVTVAWDYDPDEHEGFRGRWGAPNNPAGSIDLDATARTWRNSGYSPGTTYQVWVDAWRRIGVTREYSPAASVTFTTPAA